MNHDALSVVLHYCEKLSQQMRAVSEETEKKKAEREKLQLQKESARLEAIKVRLHPIDPRSKTREAELNAQAIRTTTREIEDVIQRYRRENRKWRHDSHHKQLLKEIDLERNKLIGLEVELELIRSNKGTRTDSQIPALITEFANKFTKLKRCLNKLKLMIRRYEMSVNDIISEGSQAKLFVTDLQAKFHLRQKQESELQDQLREGAIALGVKSHSWGSGTGNSQKQTTMQNWNDVDTEVIKERLINERETNKQLDSLLVQAQNWLLQEESFKREVEALEIANDV